MAKTILVTGGGRGIGRGICLTLASNGYSVLINYAGNEEAARETQRLCSEAAIGSNQSFHILKADISDTRQRNQLIEQAFLATGSLDGLVNNAGVAPLQRADLLDMSEESFDRLMHINLRGPVLLTQHIAKRWKDADALQGKTIIFITSVSATMVSASLFATRLAGEGALVYEIRPGIIKTDMTSAVQQKYDTLLEQGIVPQMRWGLPEDIGRTVNSLLSGGLPFSTGTVITVDGGLAIPRL